jgi:hypothetical protein
VLGDAAAEIIGDSYVECARAARKNVNVILVVFETHAVRVTSAITGTSEGKKR